MATLATVEPIGASKLKPRRQRMLQLHLYAGLAASAFVIVIGLTGALLAFREPIDRLFNPRLSNVRPAATRLPLSKVADNVRAAFPGQTLLGLQLPEKPEDALAAIVRGPDHEMNQIAVNPYTGEVLGDWNHSNHFMDRVAWLHKNLVVGEGLTKLASLAMVLLCISGVVLWFKRKKMLPNPSASGHIFALDLHSAIGIYAAVFLFVFAITALHPIPPVLFMKGRRFISRDEVEKQKLTPARFTPEQLITVAQSAVPGATPTWVDTTFEPLKGHLIVGFRYPEDHSPNGQTHVGIDPSSGQVVSVQGPRTMSAVARFALVTDMEIHTGVVWGNVSRVIASISGLSMSLLALTGPMIWWLRRNRTP